MYQRQLTTQSAQGLGSLPALHECMGGLVFLIDGTLYLYIKCLTTGSVWGRMSALQLCLRPQPLHFTFGCVELLL